MTYDAVCGEKEGGTLRLAASFPLPRDRLLLAKILGALAPILLTFGLPLLLGIGVILLMPDVRFQAPEMMRLGLILVAFGLYLAALVCAGVLGSSLVHRAGASFTILLFFWVGTVIVLPRMGLMVADVFRPAPSTQQLQAETWAVGNGFNQQRVVLLDEWVRAFQSRTGKGWRETPQGREEHTLADERFAKEAQAKTQPEVRHLEGAFVNRYNARLDLAVLLARLSPAFALNNAVVRLSGTGLERHRRFQEAYSLAKANASRWNWESQIRSGLSEANPTKYGKYVPNLSEIPRLAYHDTWPGEDVQTALIDFGVLVLWGLVFFAGAYGATLKYDFR